MLCDYFSDSYETARQRFKAAAETAGAKSSELRLEALSPSGNTLTVDVAILGAERPKRAIVHTSGLHGVEGFAGSAIQLSLLEQALVHRIESLLEDLELYRLYEEEAPRATRDPSLANEWISEIQGIAERWESTALRARIGTALRSLAEGLPGLAERRDADLEQRIWKLEQRDPPMCRHGAMVIRRTESTIFWGCRSYGNQGFQKVVSLRRSDSEFLFD